MSRCSSASSRSISGRHGSGVDSPAWTRALRSSALAGSASAPSGASEPLARCLIIGCGCRGGALARVLVERGHAVRGTTRQQARAAEIEAAGAEPFIADPDRVATLMSALDHVAVVCVLLGSARGPHDEIEALHESRLQMLLGRLIDTTVRGLVYETQGSVPGEVLTAGGERVTRICSGSRMPFVLLDASPDDHGGWLASALDAVERLVS